MERKLPENWPKVKLGELERKNILWMRSGFPCGTNNESDKGIPQLRPMNIDNSGQIDLTSVKYIETDNDVTKYYVKNKDIIFNNTNSHELVGKTALWDKKPDEYVLSNHMTIMRLANDGGLEPHFLAKYFYYLWSNGYFSQIRRPYVNQAGIDLDKLRGIVIPIPPLETQHRIVAILEKAEETRRLRAQADELARKLIQSVFLEMFGDPVKNPKGWKTEKLKAISEKFSDGPFGSNLKTEHYTDKGIRVVRLQNIGISKFIDCDRAYISQEHFSILQKHVCIPGDVLIGTMGDPNLRACMLPESVAVAINKADCVQCRPNRNKVLPEYVCHLMNLPSLLKAASNLVHGETRGRISSGQLANLSIPIPPLSFQERFDRIVEAAEQMISNQNKSQEEIIKIFDSLLQKAFLGELVA